MRSIINLKNTIIIILCITIIILGVSFAYLSMQLDNVNKKISSYDVSITKVEQLTPIRGKDKSPTGIYNISNSGKTINLEFNLYAPRDEVSYKVTIKNKGTIKAQIINLIEIPDYLNNQAAANEIYPVKITHNNIVGKTLKPNEEINLNIVANFNYKEKEKTTKIPYQISILTAMK